MLKIIVVVYYGDENKWRSPTKKWHFLTILCLILIKIVSYFDQKSVSKQCATTSVLRI